MFPYSNHLFLLQYFQRKIGLVTESLIRSLGAAKIIFKGLISGVVTELQYYTEYENH